MSKKQLFQGFSEETQKQYQREARLQFGPDRVNESIKRWNGYSKEKQDQIFEEAGQIYSDMVTAMEAGKPAQSPEVQDIVSRWHDNLRNFYEPTPDLMRGLAEGYNTDARFIAFFQTLHPDLPAYLQVIINQYVDDLEYAEIARMLADDEAKRVNG
jgi:hypothetical protein